jgi:hypothetical protein
MFKQNSKYRLHFLILMFVLLVIVTVFNFYDFYEKKDGMKMIGGFVFGLMAIGYAHDLFEFIKNKKRINS